MREKRYLNNRREDNNMNIIKCVCQWESKARYCFRTLVYQAQCHGDKHSGCVLVRLLLWRYSWHLLINIYV